MWIFGGGRIVGVKVLRCVWLDFRGVFSLMEEVDVY